MATSHEIMETLARLLERVLPPNAELRLRPIAQAGMDSVLVYAEPSAYRSDSAKEFLLARLKTSGKVTYISFDSKYVDHFKRHGISTTQIASQPDFLRISLEDFERFTADAENARGVLETIFTGLFSFEAFGCCARYKQCSDERRCIHPDPLYALACQYRGHLEQSRIFYGKNKNTAQEV